MAALVFFVSTVVYSIPASAQDVDQTASPDGASVGGEPVQCTSFVSPELPVQFPPIESVTLAVAEEDGGTIVDVSLYLFGTHNSVGEVEFALASPQGTAVELLQSSDCSGSGFEVFFDDAGFPYGALLCPPIDLNFYRPLETLAAFDFEDSTGTWTLTLRDTFPLISDGELLAWTLKICVDTSGVIFADGFEAGVTSAWSIVVP